MNDSALSPVLPLRCALGENPYWDSRRQCFFWTDISAGKIHQLNMPGGEHRCIYTGEPVGGFTLQENGNLILFRVSDIVSLDPASGTVTSVRPFSDEGMKRFNDVIADPEGRVFAGTIGQSPTSGGLYRVDLNGSVTKLFAGTGCSNGMGFSPDLQAFFWTCSTRRTIFKFDYNRLTGELQNQQTYYEAPREEGVPDGLTIDAEGNIWSARWGGSSIKRHAPDGAILFSHPVPVRNVTSLCFGGKELDQLFITTAQEPGEDADMAGALFTISGMGPGRLEFRSRILA